MPLGPVFEVETSLACRRKRTYFIRFLYGLALLALVGFAYQRGMQDALISLGTERTHQAMARVGTMLFLWAATAQQIAVFALTPALVAGAVANDRQRGILVNLLTSRLTSREIVLGKLAARTLSLVMLLAVGLPIVAIVSMLGGIEPWLLLATFAASLALLWFIAGVSIFTSVVAKRARDAVLLVYVFQLGWLILPLLLRPLLTVWWTELQSLFWPLLRALELTNPFDFMTLLTRPADQWNSLYLLFLIEVVAGTFFMGMATLLLRRVEAGAVGHSRSESVPSPSWRILRRPLCDEDRPMVWKEVHVARSTLLVRLGMLAVGIPLALLLVEQTFDSAVPAFKEVWAYGYGDSPILPQRARTTFNEQLGNVCAFLFSIWVVGVASTAACSVTSEREENTWESLVCTTLSGDEILDAKRQGAQKRCRWVARAIFLCWGVGIMSGAIHPLLLPLLIGCFLAVRSFSSALGLLFSVVARNTTQAILLTSAVLLALNGFNLLFHMIGSGSVTSQIMLVIPVIMYSLMGTHGLVQFLFGEAQTDVLRRNQYAGQAMLLQSSVVGVVFYALAGFLLMMLARSALAGSGAKSPRTAVSPAPEITFVEEDPGSVTEAEQETSEPSAGKVPA